ncbi:hypothetical protein C8D77_111105 [Mesorhizobium loti]|uniref:HNH endonuclease n=1 Tax=Rhizobium loti TaxID=381 RepID=A0A8E2W853_RHILI|nr:hypothetical protein [Mesorhizobium loti]PWJ88382.1 hypothetical protein C8D77_111105 [Mesorhizobium loti]
MNVIDLYKRREKAVGKPCPYCGVKMVLGRNRSIFHTTRDHIFPRSQGGTLAIIVCFACNNEKADMSPFEWIEHLYRAGRAHHAERTICAYCQIGGVFRDGVTAPDVLDAIETFWLAEAA